MFEVSPVFKKTGSKVSDLKCPHRMACTLASPTQGYLKAKKRLRELLSDQQWHLLHVGEDSRCNEQFRKHTNRWVDNFIQRLKSIEVHCGVRHWIYHREAGATCVLTDEIGHLLQTPSRPGTGLNPPEASESAAASASQLSQFQSAVVSETYPKHHGPKDTTNNRSTSRQATGN